MTSGLDVLGDAGFPLLAFGNGGVAAEFFHLVAEAAGLGAVGVILDERFRSA